MGIRIKDAELVSEVTGVERIPVSDGSGQPKAVSTDQIKEYVIENAGDENVQSDWAETDPTSDAYIKNKPAIPNEVTEETIEDWGYTKNTGDYSKPSGGIPKSDLDESVQESLGKADTAIQAHQDISHLATKDELSKKQDVISDLEDIREGASLGKTALQSVPEEYVTMDELDRLLSDSPFEFVDLGLPSGTLWATCNVGAANPEEAGLYFAWGEIEGYKVSYTADGNVITSTTITDKDGNATDKKFSAEHYKWCDGSLDNLTKYNYDSNKGVVDNLNQLVLVDDAVYAVDRHSRMPSVADFEELIANTTFSKVVVGNRGCGKFTSKKNGNSIIFPAVGRVNVQGISGINAWAVYPTRELYKYYPSDCEIMYFTSSYLPSIGSGSRFVGLPIRAVKNKLYGNDDYYYTKEEIDAQKQDKLVSTQNIKTINGESILGSGNILIEANGNSSVDLTGYATEAWVKDEIKGKQDTISDLETIRSGAAKGATAIQQHQSLDGYVKDSDLAAVAKSGSYNDLSNKPTIPSAVTESTVSGWGFTKNKGTYVKPSSGIPLSDLADSAQESIGKGAEAYRYLGNLNSVLNGKQDKIADLDAIRSGAALGATALQEHQSLAGYATEDYVMNAINESIIQTLNGKA